MKTQYKITFLLTGLLSFGSNIVAQQTYVNKEWEESTGRVGSIDRTVSALDQNKNLVVVSNKMNAFNNTDVLITKYNEEGNLLWQKTFDGSSSGDDYGVQVKINSNNEIFVAATLIENSGVDFGILKYKSNGDLLWANSWNGNNNGVDVPADLDIDNNGNIYLVGGTSGNNSFSDYAIVKFNSSGVYQWQQNYDYANSHDVATSLKIDNSNLIVTGTSASSSTNWDFATLKIDATNGAILDSRRSSVPGVGLDNAVAVTTDQNNNTYITGYVEVSGNKNIQTVKLDVNFNLLWVKNFDGGLEDVAKALEVDNFGNIYIVGTKENYNGGKDYITIKYDSNGNEIWNKEFGSENDQYIADAEKVAINANGDIFVTGSLDKNGSKKFATIKYSPDGDLKFVKEFDAGNQNNKAKSILVDNDNIYVSGVSEINGIIQNTTVKYSSKTKPIITVTNSSGEKYVRDELLIRFKTSVINKNIIDKKEITSGVLSDFVSSNTLIELENKTGFYWGELDTYKVFLRMTTADSISITRLGDTTKLEPFWATLSVYVPSDNSEQIIADTITTLPSIIYAEKDYFAEFYSIPNDVLYSTEQSGLFDPTHGINVEQAWNKQVGQSYTKVGVFDSGINWRHEDYGDGTSSGSKIVGGWDYYNNVSPFSQGTPDGHGHGTATSGVIGALRNNNLGIAGVAGGDVQNGNTGCQLFSMAIPVTGQVNLSTLHSIASPAIVEGAAYNPNTGYGYGLHIQNHSWGDPYFSTTLRDAVKSCYKNNCVFVAASGNDADPNKPDYSPTAINYPATYNDDWVLKVGANNANGSRAIFSTYGNNIDIIAPGTNDIYATLDNDNNSGYSYSGNGTSFAAPMASGVVALLHSQHNPANNSLYPNVLSPEDVEVMLQSFVTDVFPSGYDSETGYGRIDANYALSRVTLPYRVHHFQENVSSSSATLYATNQTVSFPEGVPGTSLAIGHYVASTDIYKLTVTLPHNIPSTESYLSGWVRNSACDLYNITSAIANPYWSGCTLNNSNQNNATLTGYIYKSKINNILGQYVADRWFPTNLNSTVKFGYSIYTIDDDSSVGIEKNELINDVNIYPNPTNDIITVDFNLTEPLDANLIIYDAIGKIVANRIINKKTTGNQSAIIDLSHLSNGLYLVNLTIGSQVISKRIIKN